MTMINRKTQPDAILILYQERIHQMSKAAEHKERSKPVKTSIRKKLKVYQKQS